MIRHKVGGSRARHFVRITLAALVFYFGAALLLAAANLPVPFPPPEPWMAALPSRPLATRLLGALLVIVAMALWRRLEAGFYVSFTLWNCGAASVWSPQDRSSFWPLRLPSAGMRSTASPPASIALADIALLTSGGARKLLHRPRRGRR